MSKSIKLPLDFIYLVSYDKLISIIFIDTKDNFLKGAFSKFYMKSSIGYLN